MSEGCVEHEVGGCVGRWSPTRRCLAVARVSLGVRATMRRMPCGWPGVNADVAARYPCDPPAGWSPLDAGEAWHADDY